MVVQRRHANVAETCKSNKKKLVSLVRCVHQCRISFGTHSYSSFLFLDEFFFRNIFSSCICTSCFDVLSLHNLRWHLSSCRLHKMFPLTERSIVYALSILLILYRITGVICCCGFSLLLSDIRARKVDALEYI